MWKVRYYGNEYHPDHFRTGMLGFFIRTLNWFRWRLEILVTSMVMRYLSREEALPKEKRVELKKMFSLDVRADELEKDASSPLVPPRATPLFGTDAPADRYQAGRQQSVLDSFRDEELPVRPSSFEPLANRLGSNNRARRYARGHRFTVVEGEDGDFEPLKGPADADRTH